MNPGNVFIVCAAIAGITIVSTAAVLHGFDSHIVTAAIASLAGFAAYGAGKMIER